MVPCSLNVVSRSGPSGAKINRIGKGFILHKLAFFTALAAQA